MNLFIQTSIVLKMVTTELDVEKWISSDFIEFATKQNIFSKFFIYGHFYRSLSHIVFS